MEVVCCFFLLHSLLQSVSQGRAQSSGQAVKVARVPVPALSSHPYTALEKRSKVTCKGQIGAWSRNLRSSLLDLLLLPSAVREPKKDEKSILREH
jgi:hypothetical protein